MSFTIESPAFAIASRVASISCARYSSRAPSLIAVFAASFDSRSEAQPTSATRTLRITVAPEIAHSFALTEKRHDRGSMRGRGSRDSTGIRPNGTRGILRPGTLGCGTRIRIQPKPGIRSFGRRTLGLGSFGLGIVGPSPQKSRPHGGHRGTFGLSKI